jgi:hypothetical protein
MGDFLRGLSSLIWAVGSFATIYYFREQIGRLFHRLKAIGKDGLTLQDAVDEQRAQAIAARPITDIVATAFPNERPMPWAETMAAALRAELDSKNLPVGEQVDLLLYRLAERNANISVLKAFHMSFRTQLDALDAMALSPAAIDLMPYYLIHKRDFDAIKLEGKITLSFEQWANHFINYNLATVTGTSGQITDLGRYFLNVMSGTPRNAVC